jgi:hypothetical protein
MRRTILVGACLLAVSGLASATNTFALYGTGFNSSGSALPTDGTQKDGNWTLESGPTVLTSGGCNAPCVSSVTYSEDPFVTETGQFPFSGVSPAWLPDFVTSQWISPRGSETTDSDPWSASVPYIYQESFNLTGLALSSVVITGQWSADNYGYIEVNGTQVTLGTAGNITNAAGQFSSFTSFVLNSSNASFVSGANTIEFVVFNSSSGGPDVTGLNVDIESDSANSATPEPASIGLTGLGLAALAFFARRRSA